MLVKKQKMRFVLMLFILVSGLFLVAACGKPKAKINSITIQKNDITIGSSLTLDIYEASEHVFTVVVDKQGDISEAVTFTSSDTSVATITANGTLTLVAAGSATITATSVADNSISVSFTLTVVDTSPAPSITSVVIDSKGAGDKIELELSNENVTLTATVVVVAGASQAVTWTSSDTNVAVINAETGVLSFVGVGTTNITATSTFDSTKSDTVEFIVKPQDLSKPDTVPFGWQELELVWTSDPSYGIYEGDEIDGRMPYFERLSNNYFKSMNINPGSSTFTRGDYIRFGCWVYSNKEQVVTINIPYGYNPQNAPKEYTLEANTWTWIQTDKYPASDRINGYIQATSADKLYISGMQVIKELNPGNPHIVSVKIIENAVPSGEALSPNNTYGGASGVQVDTLTINKTMGNSDFYIVPLVAAAAGASQSVVWESSDTSVATVTAVASTAANTYGFNSQLGLVHLVGGGEAILTVRSVDDPTKFATIILNVDAPASSVVSVFIEGKNQDGEIERSITDGDFTLTALVSVTGEASKDVTWASSDTDVATINPNTGLVTVVAEGETVITATSVFDDTKFDTVNLIIGEETVLLPDAIPEGWEEIALNWTADATYVLYEGPAVDGRMPYFVRASNNYLKGMNINPGANTFAKGDYLRFGCWVYSNKEQVVTINIPYGYNPQNAPKTYTLEANTWTWLQTDPYPASDRINGYLQATNADVVYVSGLQLIKETNPGDSEIHSVKIITGAVPTVGTLASNGTYKGDQVSEIEIDKFSSDDDFYVVPLVAAANGASQSVTWESSDTSVATVTAINAIPANNYGFNSELGLVSIVGPGTVILTVKSVDDPTKFATVTLVVEDTTPVVTSVLINGKNLDGKIEKDVADGTFTLTATVNVKHGASQDVIWASSDTDVATIDPDTGLVTVIAEGETIITATSVFDEAKSDSVSLVLSQAPEPSPDEIPDGWEEIVLTNWTADGSFAKYNGDPIDGRMPYFERVSNHYFKGMNINPGANTFAKGDYIRFGCWVYSNQEQVVTINIPYGYNPQNAPKTYTLEANTWTWIQTDPYPASDRINGYLQANNADKFYISGMQVIKESVPGDAHIHSIKLIGSAVPSGETLAPNNTYGGSAGVQSSSLEIEKLDTAADFYIVPLVAAAYGASQDVIWESSDTSIATVTAKVSTASNTYGFNSQLGLVHIVGPGTVTLTVKAKDDETKFATVTLVVEDTTSVVTSVLINGKNLDGKIEKDIADGTFTLTATVDVKYGASQEVVWESSDTDVATIDPNTGLVTVVAEGVTIITATSVFDEAKSDSVDLVLTQTPEPSPDEIPDGWEEVELNWTVQGYVAYSDEEIDGKMPEFSRGSSNYLKSLDIHPGGGRFTKGDYLRFGCWVYSNQEQVITINIPYGHNPQNAPKTYTLEANTWTWIQTDPYPASDRINGYLQANGADELYVSGLQLIKETSPGDPEIHSVKIITGAVPTVGTLASNGTYKGAQVSEIEIEKLDTADDFYIVPLVAAANGASQSVTWESSDTSVATVTAIDAIPANNYGFNSELGLVNIVGPGTVTLTVKSVDDPTKFATVILVVEDTNPAVVSVLIDGKNLDGKIEKNFNDGNFTLTATVDVKYGASQEVVWESSDTDVATIDPNTGLVTVIAEGETIITATSVFDNTKLDTAELVLSLPIPGPDEIPDGWEEVELNWTVQGYVVYSGEEIDGKMPEFSRGNSGYLKGMNINPGASTFAKGDYLRFGCWVYSNQEQVITINIPYGYNPQNAPKTYTLEANTWTWIQTDPYPASDRINGYLQANSADELYVSGLQLIKETSPGNPEIHSVKIITGAVPTVGTLASNGTYKGAQVSEIEIEKLDTDDDFYIVPLVAAANGASQSVTWESSDTSVATVTAIDEIPASNYGFNSELGLVSIIGPGTVILTVKSVDDPTKFATVTLVVEDTTPVVTSVLINGKNLDGKIEKDVADGTFTLTATVNVKHGASQEVVWESSDTDVATINPDTGLVTVIAEGETIITATSVFDNTKLDTAELVLSLPIPGPDEIPDGWEEVELNWTVQGYVVYSGEEIDGKMPEFSRGSSNYLKSLDIHPGGGRFILGDYLRFGCWVYSNKEQVITINIPYGYNPQNAPKVYTLEANTWTWIQTDPYPASNRINGYLQANNADELYVSGLQLIKETSPGDPEIHSIKIITNAAPSGETLAPNGTYGGAQVSEIEIEKLASDADFYIVPLVAAANGASQNVTWESSDTSVATVTAVASTASNTYGFNSELGFVNIVGPGTVTLTVKSVDDPTKIATVTLIIT